MTFMSFIGPLLLAGLLHMEESYCMLYMPVYLVTIPSMYILLVIYSLFNLWNTGENNSFIVIMSSSFASQIYPIQLPIGTCHLSLLINCQA